MNYYSKNAALLPLAIALRLDDLEPAPLPALTDGSWVAAKQRNLSDFIPVIGSASREIESWSWAVTPKGWGIVDFMPAIYVIERDPREFRALLESRDMTKELSYPELFLCVGEDPERWLATILSSPEVMLPGAFSPLVSPWAVDLAHNVGLQREATLRPNIEQQPNNPVHDQLSAKPKNPTILVQATRHSTVLRYVAESLVSGFERIGCPVYLAQESRPSGMLTGHVIAAKVMDVHPDAVVSISGQRSGVHPLIPHVNWIQDEMPSLLRAEVVKRLGPTDLSFALSSDMCARYENSGYQNVKLLQFAVDDAVFTPPPNDDDREGSVAHITHVPEIREHEDTPGWIKYLDADYSEHGIARLSNAECEPLLDRAIEIYGWKVHDRAWTVRAASQHYRVLDRVAVTYALIAAGIPLALYGDGWERFAGLRRLHRGKVVGREALRDVYRKHRAVLHMNKMINLHSRVLEGFACGAMVLSRADQTDTMPGEGLCQIDPALDTVWDYSNRDELIKRALTDRAWSRDRVAAIRGAVLKSHSYVARAASIRDRVLSVL